MLLPALGQTPRIYAALQLSLSPTREEDKHLMPIGYLTEELELDSIEGRIELVRRDRTNLTWAVRKWIEGEANAHQDNPEQSSKGEKFAVAGGHSSSSTFSTSQMAASTKTEKPRSTVIPAPGVLDAEN